MVSTIGMKTKVWNCLSVGWAWSKHFLQLFQSVVSLYPKFTTTVSVWWVCIRSLPHLFHCGESVSEVYHTSFSVVSPYQKFNTTVSVWWVCIRSLPYLFQCGESVSEVYTRLVSLVRWVCSRSLQQLFQCSESVSEVYTTPDSLW